MVFSPMTSYPSPSLRAPSPLLLLRQAPFNHRPSPLALHSPLPSPLSSLPSPPPRSPHSPLLSPFLPLLSPLSPRSSALARPASPRGVPFLPGPAPFNHPGSPHPPHPRAAVQARTCGKPAASCGVLLLQLLLQLMGGRTPASASTAVAGTLP